MQVRLFALCHERRNLAEYEGYMDEDQASRRGCLFQCVSTLIHTKKFPSAPELSVLIVEKFRNNAEYVRYAKV